MTIFSLALAIYLAVGLILAGITMLSISLTEKECLEHSEDRQEQEKLMQLLGTKVKNPKLIIFITAMLFWPGALSNINQK